MNESTEDVFYHGTRRGFTRGGVVMPRSFHLSAPTGAPTNEGQQPVSDADTWVYVTRSRVLAWVYAWHAPGRGSPKVLVVHPHEDLEPDPEHSAAMDAWRCRWATVAKVLTEPDVTEAEAREGWVTSGSAVRG